MHELVSAAVLLLQNLLHCIHGERRQHTLQIVTGQRLQSRPSLYQKHDQQGVLMR